MTYRSRLFIRIVFLCGLCLPLPVAAQTPPANDALPLVVRVRAYPAPGDYPSIGTGIIVGVDTKSVYIATAEHVIRGGGRGDQRWVAISFSADTLHDVHAAIRDSSRAADLAVLTVPIDSLPAPLGDVDFLGDAGVGEPVWPIGCAVTGFGCWSPPVSPDFVQWRDPGQIRFQTNVATKGHSGGPLWNRHGEIVGMILRVAGNVGTATPIDVLLSQIQGLDTIPVPSHLSAPAVSRGGYGLFLETQFFHPFNTEPIVGPDGRSLLEGFDRHVKFPSVRASVSRRVTRALSVHVTGLRLAPDNLAIYGALVGVGLDGRISDHVSIHLFGEVGGGRIEGQFDAGGFVVDEGGVNRYEPFWTRVEDSAIGFGIGARFRYILVKGLAFEGMLAHWGFPIPDDLPGVPDFFLGGGISKGF